MIRTSLLLPVALLLWGSPILLQEEDLSSPKLRIEWAEFKKLYDANRIEVVDVRGADAFEAGHIPGSRSIPLDQIARRADALKTLKKPLVLYCA